MPLALLLATLASLPHTTPAKAGAQLGEVEREGPGSGPVTGPKSMSPIDAERAFAADAKAIGQWTAFRKWSTDDAVMFVPQPTNAHDFLKDRKDPPKAIDWWPTASWMSCDGSLAVNTGGWRRPDGNVGYFSTVWQRQKDGGWKWIVDGGDNLKVSRSETKQPTVRRASCTGKVIRPGAPITVDGQVDAGASQDKTLNWQWITGSDGSRVFNVTFWNGRIAEQVVEDEIPGSPPNK